MWQEVEKIILTSIETWRLNKNLVKIKRGKI